MVTIDIDAKGGNAMTAGGDGPRTPGPRTGTAKERPRASRAPGVKDVAALAGVSVGTVSNVINGRGTVRDAVRERVETAIKDLGYVPNPTAQALRRGVSPVVGVAVFDLTNPFFMEAAAGIEKRLSEEGCVMSLASTHSDPTREAALLRTLAGQAVRGILLTPADTDLGVARELLERGIPLVLFDFPDTPADISSISIDDRAGATLAIEHLLALGHRRLLFLNGPSTVRQARSRARGVEDAVAHWNARESSGSEFSTPKVRLESVNVEDFSVKAGRTWMRAYLEAQGLLGASAQAAGAPAAEPPADLPTGIFCANDLIAFGAMTALRDAGLRVPEDVSVVGFDDISMAADMPTPLTTIHQPMEELGTEAVDLLFASSKPNSSVAHLKFYPRLVVRRSTAAPAR